MNGWLSDALKNVKTTFDYSNRTSLDILNGLNNPQLVASETLFKYMRYMYMNLTLDVKADYDNTMEARINSVIVWCWMVGLAMVLIPFVMWSPFIVHLRDDVMNIKKVLKMLPIQSILQNKALMKFLLMTSNNLLDG